VTIVNRLKENISNTFCVEKEYLMKCIEIQGVDPDSRQIGIVIEDFCLPELDTI
jgi:hypothetical protein